MLKNEHMKKTAAKNLPITAITIVLILVIGLVGFLMIVNQKTNILSAQPAVNPTPIFVGAYRVGDGQWCAYTEETHIPATKGDVTLVGQIYLSMEGERFFVPEVPLTIYLDHIGCEAYFGDQMVYVSDCENEAFGNRACGTMWSGALMTPPAEDVELTIVFKNPHKVGNEDAIDTFFKSFHSGDISLLREQLLEESQTQHTVAIIVFVMAIALLGVSVFATVMRIPQTGVLWLFTLVAISAGGWIFFGAENITLWNPEHIVNTTGNEICKMMYGLFVSVLCVFGLEGKLKKVGDIAVAFLGIFVAILILTPAVFKLKIYDMIPFWMTAQGIVAVALIVISVINVFLGPGWKRYLAIPCSALGMVALLDMISTYLGWWSSGLASQHIFMVFFVGAIIAVLGIIPNNIRSAMRAKELEKELTDSRISTMISQIQPHFIYNTLGTVEQLCLTEPKTASTIVHNFALYLRGNFRELDNPAPIRLEKELKHLKHYTDIEQVRFPDMSIVYELESEDFLLPALTIQPLVENAIKHGLMKLETGGTVKIKTFETDTHYWTQVVDNGVGFDTTQVLEQKEHVGIRNIRVRLEAMCDGTLTIESVPGEGTTATIMIPKEV